MMYMIDSIHCDDGMGRDIEVDLSACPAFQQRMNEISEQLNILGEEIADLSIYMTKRVDEIFNEYYNENSRVMMNLDNL